MGMAVRRYGGVGILVLLLGACAKSATTAASAPAPVADTVYVTMADTVRVEAPRDTVHERLAGRLQMELLEREAEVADLRQKLDEAIREVVRTMARLQTAPTRAEAASAMAEAELAYQALRKRPGTGMVALEAKRLLDQSSGEFARSNYAGAIYLAGQAKNVARATASLGNAADGSPVAGEVPFATPISLTVTARANVREGPGTRFPVRLTLERGAVIRGISYAGDWIRVANQDGTGGWILGALLEGQARSGQ